MALSIFVFSPLPGELDRTPFWNENVNLYDSGDSQGATNYIKPLYQYTIPIRLMNEVKQSSVWTFFRDVTKGMTTPFLMKDPYDFRVNSVAGVRSGITNAATTFLYDTNSYMVRADTASVGSLFSTLSGFVKLGTQYSYDQDSGVLTVNTKATADVWGVRSMTYFRKVRLMQPYKERSIMWNLFSVDGLNFQEMP